ncbi:MAG TPA: NADP-dependent isocitrate dehydrogenase, partial [Pontiella sp.]
MNQSYIKAPTSGEGIRLDCSGKLSIPDAPIVPFIEGDGVGPEITAAMRQIVDSAVQKAYGGKRC